MQICEIMTREVETVPPDASLQKAAAAMEAVGVGSLPVCQGRRLVGAITDRDIVVRGVATGASPVDMLVRDCMSADISYAFEDEDVDAALKAHGSAADSPARRARPSEEPGRHRLPGRH